jgi:hypothetical protein
MTPHRIFARGTAASLIASAIVLFASSGCGSSSSKCDGSKRGCVYLSNTTVSDVTVRVAGGGSAVVPSGTQSNPGISWVTVDSTVGAQVTFSVSNFNPGIETCVVEAHTWTDPSKPPGVNLYQTGAGLALGCVNWCTTTSVGCGG